jgi:predicted MFS family arabinose efflux permease
MIERADEMSEAALVLEPPPEGVTREAWRVLRLAVFAQVGFSLIDQGVPTLTGFVKDDLGVSAGAAGLVVSTFAFGKIFGSYAAGELADRIGERRVLLVGGLVTGGLLGAAMASPTLLLVVGLGLAGVASAAATPAGGRLVLTAFPPNRRGLALGIRQTGVPVAGLLAAAMLPWIAHTASWRWAIACGGALTALFVLPLTRMPSEARTVDRVERGTAPSPARDRNVRLLTLWGCFVVTGQFATLAFLALDLHRGAHLSLPEGSLLVAVAQAAGIAGRISWGAISDRVLHRGRKPLMLTLTAVGLSAALLLFAVPRSAPVWVFVVVAALAGYALIGYQGLWITMVAEAAGPERVGAATGFAVTFVVAAVAVTPPFFGFVADQAGTYRAIWGVLACVLALSFIPALLVRESS